MSYNYLINRLNNRENPLISELLLAKDEIILQLLVKVNEIRKG